MIKAATLMIAASLNIDLKNRHPDECRPYALTYASLPSPGTGEGGVAVQASAEHSAPDEGLDLARSVEYVASPSPVTFEAVMAEPCSAWTASNLPSSPVPGEGSEASNDGNLARMGLRRGDGYRSVLWLAGIQLALICVLAGSSLATAAETVFDPVTGYRVSQYRSPVPPKVPGGKTVTVEDVVTLRDHGAVFIDVMPSEGAGADATTGVWHVPKPRENMVGSVWLPDVGKGVLTPELEAYFKTNLARLTAGDTSKAVVIYCQADCWMSWNAVKRAAGYGYTALFWYPEGTDGMRDWDIPLAPSVPVAMAPRP
jgi:PQQ-dependent catabolism-associated CXXCW motif protein